MGKTNAEAVGLCMAPQPVLGTDPTAEWMRLQPEKGTLQNVKRQNETVEDTVHSKAMTQKKGDVVGWKVAPQYGHKVNKDWLDLHAGPMFRCIGVHPGGKGVRRYRVTAVVDGGAAEDSLTVAALGDLPANTLIFVRGSAVPQNNGVFKTVAGSTADAIKVATGTWVAEAAPPANMTVDVIGFELAADDCGMDANGNITSVVEDFTTRGIPVGSRMVIGTGVLGTSNTSFGSRKNNALVYAKSVAAHLIETERGCFTTTEEWAPVADAGAGKTIQIILGSFYRNYAIDDALYSEQFLYLEKEDPKAGSDGTTRYTYCMGLVPNKVPISAPLKNKIIATPSYVGTDATKPLPVADRVGGLGAVAGDSPAKAYAPLATAFADTANDLKLVRMTKANGTLVGEINSWTLTLDNGATPKEVQGTPGAIDVFFGTFAHSLTVEAYYNNSAALDSATDNDDLQWDAYVRNHQFAFNFDLPLVAIREDQLNYEPNMQIKLNFSTPAFENEDTGICGALTLFGYVPDRS